MIYMNIIYINECVLIVLIVFAKTGSGQNNAKEKVGGGEEKRKGEVHLKFDFSAQKPHTFQTQGRKTESESGGAI
eukprot:COSAG06_NODE_35861_length_454_cov_4.884507_1_plen_75_part_00